MTQPDDPNLFQLPPTETMDLAAIDAALHALQADIEATLPAAVPPPPDPDVPGTTLNSPMGLAAEVDRLMKLPQHLCKQRGICCKVATFKGSLSHADILALAADPQADGHEVARDFASIFLPYESQDAVRQIAPEFVDRVRDFAATKGQDPDTITFFYCKYVLSDGRCGVHEDRPVGCRVYPFPHKNTIYHPGCGFEQQGKLNWARIEEILQSLGMNDLT